jgi:amino acid transporter
LWIAGLPPQIYSDWTPLMDFRVITTQIKNALFGRPIATEDAPDQTIGPFVGLAVLASDNLSSVAYATEEILLILAAVGAANFGLSIPIAMAIIGLLLLLTLSYKQTIFAYPSGGGAYTVAKDNIGETVAQIAGAALLTDYVLTVAVSISSGVDQVASVFPHLHGAQVQICLILVAFIMLMNLRGVKESGTVFAFPTYFFVSMMLLTVVVGLIRWALGDLTPVEGVEMVHRVPENLGIFLVLKAFSSGCTAVTGVEAVSNGISVFREPRVKNATKTLTAMASLLGIFFLGITFLAHQVNALPSETETIISQVGRSIFGRGFLYQCLMAGTTIILVMAANTSYADFPRLCALHAGDGYLPRQLAYRGGRLVYVWGIVFLSVASAVLIVAFHAHTSSLIPLYCIGVFLSFTISQIGMVIHWHRIGKDRDHPQIKGWRMKQMINLAGAITSGLVAMVFAFTKFQSGAWITILLIPAMVFVFLKIHDHYSSVGKYLSLPWKKADLVPYKSMRTIVLVDDVHTGTIEMIKFAKTLAHPWVGLHVNFDEARAASVQKKWDEKIGESELVKVHSPYRLLLEPIQEYIFNELKRLDHGIVHVITGQLVVGNDLTQLLHSKNARGIFHELQKMEHVIVTGVPYHM